MAVVDPKSVSRLLGRTLITPLVAACVPEGPPTGANLDDSVMGEVEVQPRAVEQRPLDPSLDAPFFDGFERPELGPAWRALSDAWYLEDGELCAKGAKNQGIWLRRRLPTNARIAFDARARHPDGDIKSELWGDGRSGAAAARYADASGYVIVFGGWQNSLHVLARRDEHGDERLVTQTSPRGASAAEQPVEPGRSYRFEIERSDGGTLSWRVDGALVHELVDVEPLSGPDHDHFGFNNWLAPVCFDNLRIEPLDG